jgi:transposase
MSLPDQTRCTELAETLAWRAIERIFQRLLPGGGPVASVMTRATIAAAIEALRRRPGLSASPSRPDPAKREDYIETRLGVVLSRSATASTPRSSTRSRVMLPHSRSRTPIAKDRERRRSSATTLGSPYSRLIGRAIFATPRHRIGMPWRGLAARFGDRKNVHQRFSRWAKSGVWERVFLHLSADADNKYAMIDSTIVRAHQHSAAAKKRAGRTSRRGDRVGD